MIHEQTARPHALNPGATHSAIVALAAFMLAGAAQAQPWSTMPEPLRRVEAGTADIDPLRLSLREMQVDLRRPTGFDTVYRLDAAPQLGASGSMFMRMDGGITATFPQSVYRDSAGGPIPEIPPGTVFHIGPLPTSMLTETPARPRGPGYLDLSIDARATAADEQNRPPQVEAPRERSIWNDENYRNYRIERLLSGAMESGGAGRASPVR